MKIKIKETNEIVTLRYTDRNSGVNNIADLIGNHGGFGSDEHQFEHDAERGVYIASRDTVEWWEKVAADMEALDERIDELKLEHGSDAVYDAIQHVNSVDLEYHAAEVHAALDEAFGERK